MNQAAEILIVDDEAEIRQLLRIYLGAQGFRICEADTGTAARRHLERQRPDLALVDLGLPDEDGLSLIRNLRERYQLPIIILTGRGDTIDKIVGLELGADDYVTKPFDMDELVARISAVLRRSGHDLDRLCLGATVIDFRNQRATGPRGDLHLTQREIEVLHYLASRKDRVVPRDDILRAVWGFIDPPTTRSVDHAIARLRKKIEPDPHTPRFLHTAFGDGYRLTF